MADTKQRVMVESVFNLREQHKGGIEMNDKLKFLIATLVVVTLSMVVVLTSTRVQPSLGADDILYVDADASGANDGSTWEDAFTALQPALEAAISGDQIWVAAGTYTPTLEFSPGDPRSATLQMKNGVAIYGGFDPSVGDVDLEDRDWVNNLTVLSGDIGVTGDASDNSYHVLYHPVDLALDSSAILDGFTITAGNANGAENPHNLGGGMFNAGSNPDLTNIIISTNSASSGGGMYNTQSNPLLTNVTIFKNSATFDGGGILDNIISNGDFENGQDGSWEEYSSNGYDLIVQGFDPTGVTPHSGEWGVWLGGAAYEVSTLSQTVTIPAGNPTLSYWIYLASQETFCGNDTGKITVNNISLESFNL
jgi:hypothetical protein